MQRQAAGRESKQENTQGVGQVEAMGRREAGSQAGIAARLLPAQLVARLTPAHLQPMGVEGQETVTL